jgi:hypothetical protein
MATRSRLRRRSELKARALLKATLRSFWLNVAVFLSTLIVVVVLTWDGTHSEDDISIGVLMVLAHSHFFVPVRSVPYVPKQR